MAAVTGAILGGAAAAAAGAGINAATGAGETKIDTSPVYSKMSDEEKKRLDAIENQVLQLYQQNPDVMEGLFRQQLTSFVSSDPYSPAATSKAAAYVDQLFTNPAQAAVNQQVADYTSNAQAQAAAMGRSPNLDVATQQAIAAEAMRQNLGLQQARGQMINEQVGNQRNADLQNLQTLQSGSGFLSDLANRAFANRLSLLNARSGLANYYQQDRMIKPVGISQSPGLLGQIAAGASSLNSTMGTIKGLGTGLGLSPTAQPEPKPTEYTSSSQGLGNTGNYKLGGFRF